MWKGALDAAGWARARAFGGPTLGCSCDRETTMARLTYADVLPVMDEAVRRCPNAVLRRDVLAAAAAGLALNRPEDPVAFVVALLAKPMGAARLPMHRPRSAPTVRRPVTCHRHPPSPRPVSASPPPSPVRLLPFEVEQIAAVNMIAAAQRGHAGRARVRRLRVEHELGLTGSEDERAAITRIQAQQRGQADRRRIRQIKGQQIEESLGLVGSEEERAAITRLQAQQRGNITRKSLSTRPVE